MCGIIGVVGKLPSQKLFEEARDVLAHRGPDDKGIYIEPNESVALGHRRLSIIDLSSAGHQPFFSSDKRYVLTFNGEIYNYLEIREELRDFYNFKTNTDTEVLLAAYIKWGKHCLEKFNGMFAFAIWDRKEKKLFCARDRMNIKPFYYSLVGDTLYFASEIKALFKLGIKQRANQDTIFIYLNYGFYDYDEKTFFEDIKRFPAGHFGYFRDGKLRIEKYWDLAETTSRSKGMSDREIEEQFKFLVADSIKLRFRSDVPVGVNLSSGLDSNSILHYAYEVTNNKDIHTFSRCMRSEDYNECSLISQYLTAGQKKFWNQCYFEPEEVFDLTDEMITIQDQPFGGITTVSNIRMNGRAKQKGITVILEGQGGDELLAGYRYYLPEHQKDLAGQKVNTTAERITGTRRGQDMTLPIDQGILNRDFVKEHIGNSPVLRNPTDSHLLNAQYRDITQLKIPRAQRFNDHTSMNFSLELRFPFLDHRIVEFCFWLDSKYKINGGDQKYLMRKTMSEFLPANVKSKKKKAFGAIQGEWFRKYHRDKILNLLNSGSFKARPYWDHKKLSEKIQRFFQGEGNNSFWLWQAINLELWFRKNID